MLWINSLGAIKKLMEIIIKHTIIGMIFSEVKLKMIENNMIACLPNWDKNSTVIPHNIPINKGV